MKDNFALFPHFTHSDATLVLLQTLTHTHTHTHTHKPTSNMTSKRWESKLGKTMLLVKSILDF